MGAAGSCIAGRFRIDLRKNVCPSTSLQQTVGVKVFHETDYTTL